MHVDTSLVSLFLDYGQVSFCHASKLDLFVPKTGNLGLLTNMIGTVFLEFLKLFL